MRARHCLCISIRRERPEGYIWGSVPRTAHVREEGVGRGGRRRSDQVGSKQAGRVERETERELLACTAAVDWSLRYLRSVGEGGIKNGAVSSGGREAESGRIRGSELCNSSRVQREREGLLAGVARCGPHRQGTGEDRGNRTGRGLVGDMTEIFAATAHGFIVTCRTTTVKSCLIAKTFGILVL